MVNGWKITAIIFIILFIVETIGVIWLFSIGINAIDNKNACISQCNYKKAVSFGYDDNTNICSCFNSDGETFYQEIIK